MSETTAERPPYRFAAAVSGVVLLVYALTLAPSVTWWDAGELIAAIHGLGIPHPPATPLFVLAGHLWSAVLPIGSYTVRTNLLSAVCSALAAGGFFLVLHRSMAEKGSAAAAPAARWLRLAGSAAGALLAAFTFTVWQNANETEVYAAALLLIAALCWLVVRWRARRREAGASRLLLLAVFLLGLAVATHLLALLAGPAVIAGVAAALLHEPAAAPADARREWGETAVLAGVWALLVGTGLGNVTLMLVGAVCFAAAFAFAASRGAARFAVAALVLAAIGVSPYLFVLIRSGQHPWLNEAQPDTWHALLAVVSRAQYPVRTPFDDPTVLHGTDNPGRSLVIVGLQIAEYFLYFVWQWARGVSSDLIRIVVWIGFVALGIRGALAQRRSDRATWWMLFVLWLVTGVGLVAYMNFKPAAQLGWGRFPDASSHEVRDRDYFFVVSFLVWGLWAGIGLAATARWWIERGTLKLGGALGLIGAVTLVPVVLNWPAATRRGAGAALPADLAYDLLNTVPPYGILFTYGDNDTFPLWWAQEVAGVRRDVTVVCLALANTHWYIRQLRDAQPAPFDPAAAPPIWRGLHPEFPSRPLHSMTDEQIAEATPERLGRAVTIRLGPLVVTLPAGMVLQPSDVVTLRIVDQNAGRRPIVWATTTGRGFSGLGRFVVQQGLGFRLVPSDSAATGFLPTGGGSPPLDVGLTHSLAWDTYRYAGLAQGGVDALEPTGAALAGLLAEPLTQLAVAAEQRGDSAAVVRNLERAEALAPDPAIEASLARYRSNMHLGR